MSPFLLAPIQEIWRPTHIYEGCQVNTGESCRADWNCARPMTAPALTAVQTKILTYVWGYQQLWGESPLYREIAANCGLRSESAVCYQISRLVELGALRKPPRRVRALILNLVPVKVT